MASQNKSILTWFLLILTITSLQAKPFEMDLDTWLGYGIPRYADDTASTCSRFKSLGNNCQFGGMSFGLDVWLKQWSSISLGVGMAYLPVSAGSIMITDQQLLNLSQSLFPIVLETRYELGIFFVSMGAGYAIPLETPKLFPNAPITYERSPLVPLETAIGLDMPITAGTSFVLLSKFYAFIATKTGGTFYEYVPSVAIRVRLGYSKNE